MKRCRYNWVCGCVRKLNLFDISFVQQFFVAIFKPHVVCVIRILCVPFHPFDRLITYWMVDQQYIAEYLLQMYFTFTGIVLNT